MDIGIHNVTRVELSASFPSNGNSKTLRITSVNWKDEESTVEITLYGDTSALNGFPLSSDFRLSTATDKAEAIDSALSPVAAE